MNFDSSLRKRWSQSAGAWHFDMPTGWMQGRSVFGGLTVAAAASLAQQQIDSSRLLRVLSAQLLRPVTPGELRGSVRVVREGKATSFVETRLAQQDGEVAVACLVFAKPRAKAMHVAPSRSWPGPDPESLPDLPYVPGVTPEYTQQVAMRWVSGGIPFSGAKDAQLSGYCRFRVPAGGVAGIIGLLDAWPSPSLSLLQAPAPSSTVSWTAHIVSAPVELQGWCAFDYETLVGLDGFHTVAGHLYGPDGALLAWTEQLVAVYEPR